MSLSPSLKKYNFIKYKYSGAGNTFIIFDNRENLFPSDNRSLICDLCNPLEGKTFDGIILLEKGEIQKVNYRMRIFNSDASEAEMCGNGIRCLIRFLLDLGEGKVEYAIETLAGILKAKIDKGQIHIKMPTIKTLQLNYPVIIDNKNYLLHFINTGVPHAVIFLDEIDEVPLEHWTEILKKDPLFHPEGSNFNIAEIQKGNLIRLRTYERGVEAETLACGTGALASAYLASKFYSNYSRYQIQVASGECLSIDFTEGEKNAWMWGPVHRIH